MLIFKNLTREYHIPLAQLVRLSKFVAKLKALQSKHDPFNNFNANRDQQLIRKFDQWCKHNNVTVNGLEIRQTTTMGLGIFATNDLKADEELIIVPKRTMLSLIESKDSFNEKKLIPDAIINLFRVRRIAESTACHFSFILYNKVFSIHNVINTSHSHKIHGWSLASLSTLKYAFHMNILNQTPI